MTGTRSRSAPLASLILILLLVGPACAASVGAGARLPVRLMTPLSSRHSKPGDAVRAVLLASVPSDGQPLLPAGLELTGKVREVLQQRTQPARLRIQFEHIQRPDGPAVPISARLKDVDNSRESVAADGTILGLRRVRLKPSKKELVLMAALYAHPLLLASFEGERLLKREMEDPSIQYPAGIAMMLELSAPVEAGSLSGYVMPGRGRVTTPSEFADLAAAQPLRTEAGGRLSDQTNLLLIGAAEEVDAAFGAAGWSRADKRGVRSDLATFLAVFGHREYSAAPVSLLTLNGRAPDRVYEKQTNTFSKRHHVRIWLQPNTAGGKPVWLAAATHDIGIVFSKETRQFTHRVESEVDVERSLILNDLRFAGAVDRFTLIPRPAAARAFENSTGDHLVTDGQIVTIVLRMPASAQAR